MRMIDYTPTPEDRMDRDDFAELARQVLASRNTENFHNDWVEIRSNYNGLDLQITRNGQPEARGTKLDHLATDNPVTMVKGGEVIRNHGEYIWLVAHMRGLVSKGLCSNPNAGEYHSDCTIHGEHAGKCGEE